MINDDDKAVLLALITRYGRAWSEFTADADLKAEIEARLASTREQMRKMHSAFSIFGFNTVEKGGFLKLREAIGEDEYSEALAKGGHVPKRAMPAQAGSQNQEGAVTAEDQAVLEVRA